MIATQEELDRRLRICFRCPQVSTLGVCRRQVIAADGSKASGCGCLVRLKARLAGSQCPQGKWRTA